MSENLVEAWFGEFEFGTFCVGENPKIHENKIVLVHSIHEKKYMNPDRVEEYANGGDWLIPSQFFGDIVFSKTFFRGFVK